MLQLSEAILNRPVLSLRTGTQVATALRPIINPNNLKIEGFYCQDSESRRELILLPQDIRDAVPQGFVIDDHDVLVEASDLVRLQPIIALNFEILNKQAETVSKQKLGKINDYAVEIPSLIIKKLYVTQSLLKNLSGSNLGIDRTQIVEVTDKKVVVQDLEARVPAGAGAVA